MLRNVIERINNSFLIEAINSPGLLEDMASMEKYMAESYSGRIFVELLQNADDADSTKIKLCEYDSHLVFANNGRPFDENDVISISRSGSSSKERGVTIGYRGIGFKSTTYLTKDIIIYSNSVYFTFSKSICSLKLSIDENKIPTIRIPFLLEKIEPSLEQYVQNLVQDGFTTIFIFKNAKIDEFIDELKEITNGYFLFLKNITSCYLNVKDQKIMFSVSRERTSNGVILSLTGRKSEQWLLIEFDHMQIAFKYIEGRIIPCDDDEAVYHSYLPTLDKVIFPIKVNCDFSTEPSRKHITLDNISTNALQKVAAAIFELVCGILNGNENEKTFSSILTILSTSISFSKPNSILVEAHKRNIISTKWMKLNNGQIISPIDYRILPDWLEESEKAFIRTNSRYVRDLSLQVSVYQIVSQVDAFLQQYSQNKYHVDDLIFMMEDAEFAKKLNPHTQGKIIANIIKIGKSEQFISGKEYNLENIFVSASNRLDRISALIKDKSQKLDDSLKRSINEYASKSDLEWFCQKASFPENMIIDDTHPNLTKPEISYSKSSFNRISISKWRSAEQQCLEIEKYLGYTSTDVSKQNIGYDVESIGQNGDKRYIEVKSLTHSGAPFSMTNNEYTTALQYGEEYYLCIIVQDNNKLTATYIKNPAKYLQFEKRVRQWEWFCESYNGEEYSIEL